MHKSVLLALAVLMMVGAVIYHTFMFRPVEVEPAPIPEASLVPIANVVQGNEEDEEVSFSLNADSLDQYLAEENPFYNGGFVPELDELGMLTTASEEVLKQFTLFEFLDEENFRNDRGRSAILEYARGPVVADAAAKAAGFYTGRLQIGKARGELMISLVPVGADGLVYDAQWSFASDVVRRFRRIPEQSHWLNPYLATAWAEGEALRIEIPKGAFLNSGLAKLPIGEHVAADVVGYELRGKRSTDGGFAGDVLAVAKSAELGEIFSKSSKIGSFLLTQDAGSAPAP